MRQATLAILFVMACGSASGEVASEPSPLQSTDIWLRQKACKGVGSLAVTVMTQRQQEVPMSEMISRLQAVSEMGLYEGTGLTQNLIIGIISAAYAKPAFKSADSQKDAIASFRNDVELPCFEGKLGDKP